MAAREPQAGDRLVIVACCSRGPVAVLTSRRSAWRCGGCRSAGRDIDTIVLGDDGALPGTFDPLADSPRCWKSVAVDDVTVACGRAAGHSGKCRPGATLDEQLAPLSTQQEATSDAA